MLKPKDRPILRSDDEIVAAMDAWGPQVFRFALVSTGSVSDAEDIYQDVFLRYATDGTPFADDAHRRAWLLHVTANRCRDLHRSPWHRRRADPRVLDSLPDPDYDDPAGELERDDLWRVVERLAPKERAAVHLVYGEGFSCTEAADILKTQPSTLRTRLQRAREHLRAMLQTP